MARLLAFEVALVGLVSVFAGGAGCTSTNPGAADGAAMTPDAQSDVSLEDSSPNACIDASVKLIQASDYDESCAVDTDCQQIAEGNACVSCAFSCPLGGAINVSALAHYNSDVANTPAVGQGCPVLPCVATVFPCCIGGKCQVGSQCSNPTPTDAAADTGADGSTDGAPDGGSLDAGGE